MIKKYGLRPINAGQKIDFDGIIDKTKKNQGKWAILSNMTIVEVKNDTVPKDVLKIDFDKKSVHVFEFDDEKVKEGVVGGLEDKKIKKVVTELLDHPYVKSWQKNPYLHAGGFFILEDLNNKDINVVMKDLKIVKAFNKFFEMSSDEKQKCCYYYGQNPKMNASALVYLMVGIPSVSLGAGNLQKVDRQAGKLLSTNEFKDGFSFIDHFLDQYNDNEDNNIYANIYRALLEKKIENRHNRYFLGDLEIGVSKEDIFNFLKADNVQYQYLLQQLNRECVVIDDLGELYKKQEKLHSTIGIIEELKLELKQYGIQPHHLWQERRLREDLDNAKELKEKKDLQKKQKLNL